MFLATVAVYSPVLSGREPLLRASPVQTVARDDAPGSKSPASGVLFLSGLRAGLLTFGGAYTAIPFLQRDAVDDGGWMTERDFLDGLALSGILPAPLIIFSTFVGFFGGSFWGAILMTTGVFLPAFSFPLLLHRHLESLIHHNPLRHFLEGVTAGVIGLIAVTTVRLAITTVTDAKSAAVAGVALLILYRWNANIAVPVVMLAAGVAGAVLFS
jgi:chromate transporter